MIQDPEATPEARLRALGIELPSPVEPVADYLAVARSGDLAFVSGHVSQVRGELGSSVSKDAGRRAAHEAALGALASLRGFCGDLTRVAAIVRLTAYVRSANGFTDQPAVVDGASKLLRDAFGERGRHARSAIGVAQLPLGAAVEVELVVRVHAESPEDAV